MQLFASSQLENEDFYKMEDLANHMGLFLQKTNIIRDYLEDINEEPAPRCLTKETDRQTASVKQGICIPHSSGCLHSLPASYNRASLHSLACFWLDRLHVQSLWISVKPAYGKERYSALIQV